MLALRAARDLGRGLPRERVLPDNPFADQHLALQLSDSDAKKQSLVISVAYNLLKFYGPDRIAIEVVTFGPGIDLLRADNPNRKLVDSLIAQGVRFDVCMNTVDTIERTTGERPQLNPECHAGRGRRRPDSHSRQKRLHAGSALIRHEEWIMRDLIVAVGRNRN